MSTFAEWINKLHKEKYTGQTTIHWSQGVPKRVEYPGPQETLAHPPVAPKLPIDRKDD